MSNGNDMAFPVDYTQTPNNTYQLGLTKRELFAGMAMQGIISSLDMKVPNTDVAVAAVKMADQLLKELAK